MYALFFNNTRVSRKWPLVVAIILFHKFINVEMFKVGYRLREIKYEKR